jgi:hypothetical protein
MSGDVIAFADHGEPALDENEVRALILLNDGNLSRVAKALGSPSHLVRTFVFMRPALKSALAEVFEGLVDEAVDVIVEGMRNEGSYLVRFYAAKEMLRTETARRRGFGKEQGVAASIEVRTDSRPTTITLKWLGDEEKERKNDGSDGD